LWSPGLGTEETATTRVGLAGRCPRQSVGLFDPRHPPELLRHAAAIYLPSASRRYGGFSRRAIGSSD